MIRRALLSVSDKTGLAEFARGLAARGIQLISTGGTAGFLRREGLAVTAVAELTGFPEILDGRVKTLHPRIHGAILAQRDRPGHRNQLAEHGIEPIDLVAVNLYPFHRTVSEPGVDLAAAIENIDIGGPALLRAAAKNHEHVVVVVDPADYPGVLAAGDDIPAGLRFRLAVKAFRHTACYDAGVAEWLGRRQGWPPSEFPEELTLGFGLMSTLRYGENPHQRAAVYREFFPPAGSLAGARQLGGKELSFNNLNDAEMAWGLVRDFPETAAVAVKHATPCGAAVAATVAEAYRKAHDADPESIFGGVVAFNCALDAAAARELTAIFLEVVLAPGYEPEALAILARRRDLRVLALEPGPAVPRLEFRPIAGGLLVQEADLAPVVTQDWRPVTARRPSAGQMADLAFAWRVVRAVRSNAIVLARDGATTGIGGGQTSRVGAARIALAGAGERARGSVLASDAFFPFPDVVEAAAAAGVTAIVQPGGSLRDEASVGAADRLGLSMLFTGTRHFRH